MTTWAEESGRLFKPIPDMADDLSEDLSELSDVSCVHFEELVRFMTKRKGSTPKTVDCMAVSDKNVYLVEFKPLPGEGGGDIPGSIYKKAMSSAMLYRRFLAKEHPGKGVVFMLVTQDMRQAYASALSGRAGISPIAELENYRVRDINGEAMFFDEIEIKECRDFVKLAHRRFGAAKA